MDVWVFCLFVKMWASYGHGEDRMRNGLQILVPVGGDLSESLTSSPSVPPETLERRGEGSELKRV